MDDSLPRPKLLSSRIVFNGFFKIREDELQIQEGKPYRYSCLETPGQAVIILAETVNHEYVLIKEYRYPAREILLGLPGGYIENGEDPTKGGLRELIEETGYTATKWYLMGEAYPYPGISTQKIYFVYAKDATHLHALKLDASEVIRPFLMTEKQIQDEIYKGTPLDGILCSALYFRQMLKT